METTLNSDLDFLSIKVDDASKNEKYKKSNLLNEIAK